jgi:putative peptidoglycan lipid II flippase
VKDGGEHKQTRGAFWVALGILASRVMGLVRERVFAYYFGNSVPAGAFKAAWRIPNFVQNLFGEGVLSASFIPVYAALLGRGDEKEADHVASAVFGLLALVVSIIVSLGMIFAEPLTSIITPGFEGESHELAVLLVRIVFPGTGLLVLSAWCLGVLNSHRRFFLSYAAPVVWNIAIIASLAIFAGRMKGDLPRLAEYTMYGSVAGSLLQVLAQLPLAVKLLGVFRPSISTATESVRQVLRSFVPVLIGRGVVQVSAFVDIAIGSLLKERATSALTCAQTLYLLPVSLFGMAVSAAELPEMSRVSGGHFDSEEVSAKLRARIEGGLGRIAFFVVPSSVAFLFLGDVIGAALYETGRFTPKESRYLWYLLMGGAVGLLATTMGRLYASALYAMKDTKTPLYFATVRVTLTGLLGWWASLYLPDEVGVPSHLGAVGLLATTGLAAWVETLLLRRNLEGRIGRARLSIDAALRLYGAAVMGGLAGLGIKVALTHAFGPRPGVADEWGGDFLPAPDMYPVLSAILILGAYGLVYFAVAGLLRIPEAQAVFKRAIRLLRRT